MATPEDTVDPRRSERAGPRHRARALIRRLHFYAGVLVGPFILVAAVTGALYALAPSLERFVYRDIQTVVPSGAPLPLTDQAAAARAAVPQLEMSGMRPAYSATDSTRVYFVDPDLDAESLRAIFVDPYTGRVLGDEVTWFGQLPLSTWLDGLHRHLHLGEPGRFYSELAASWLWVVALAGLYLWVIRPAAARRLAGRRQRHTGRAKNLNRHGAIGVWVLAALLFLSATGITWSTYAGAHVGDLRSALNWQRPQLDTTAGQHPGHSGHDAPAGPADPATIDLNAVVAAAGRAGVHAPVELTLPTEPGQGITVSEIDKPLRLTTNVAAVDPHTAVVTGVVDFWRDYSVAAMLADWGIRMHMGFLFGLPNQLLLLVVALCSVMAIGLGYRMWWQRRPTRGSEWASMSNASPSKMARPPLRGGLRRLPAAGIAVTVVGAVAVGWFLPLFGLTLAAFLLVDLGVSEAKRRRARRLD